ncbi:MAG: PIN domain-containing protein [Armatimonadota bacterium]|nr:PIN domain-containing protein [Armatimonadota bacterium]
MAERYVLDTSAILAFLGDEPGAEAVERLLRGARAGRHEVLVCSITLMELFSTALRAHGEDMAARLAALAKTWPVKSVYPDDKLLLQAGRLKATYRLSVADALVAGVAIMQDATLIHKDPELDAVGARVKLLRLPARRKR